MTLASCVASTSDSSESDTTGTPTWSAISTPSDLEQKPWGTRVEVNDLSVIDGDTFDYVDDAGASVRVRLIGIDAPERGECFADEATEELRRLLSAGVTFLEADTSEIDRYGRSLFYVHTSAGMANESMVRGGYAIARRFPPDTRHGDVLEAAASEAKATGRGLWSPTACGPQPPGALVAVVIIHVEYDAPGDDSANLNGEWVELENRGSAPIDFTGWSLRDESSSHRYEFPAGYVLGPAGSVRVHSGCGSDSADVLHWCESGSAIWNNDGDTAFVRDPAGNIVATLEY